ncbi:rhodanese-like domain-containing protein [Tsuneonella amylolytica]|uniref:rhodanese-like domain-containing protein n=1 Tax=Tsuneonella amylolytica TaxID=2338327 RepID=UPI000EA9EC7C|nr:rhodanese-like domain-containing protein [Tsuneonella amylolytica]
MSAGALRIALAAGLGLAAAACGAQPDAAPGVGNSAEAGTSRAAPGIATIDAGELAGLVTRGEAVLVDVRTPEEFADGHIAGAVNRPLDTFDPSAVPREAGKRTVLYCRSGRRSLEAAERLVAAGGSATHLGGGILAWEKAGQPVTPGR